MQKIVLFLLTLSVIAISCDKTIKHPLQYTITNDVNDSAMQDIYIPDTGNYKMSVKVKFLTGFQGDKVEMVLTGLPSTITVTPDTFVGTPTFTQDFVFRNNGTPQGVYPVTLTSTTETVPAKVYNFNVIVIPADCAALYWGNLYSRSHCTSRTFDYTAIGVATGTLNTLTISNFGGYGTHCNVQVLLNCDNDSLHIVRAVYGNGVTLSGVGIFNADSMVIAYDAESIPGGGSESCTVTYKK